MGAGFLVGVIGVLILSHAAYSTVQYRSLLKITEEEFSGPPINVVIELIVSLVLCLWAALAAPGKFKSIHPQSEENRDLNLRPRVSVPTSSTLGRSVLNYVILKHSLALCHFSFSKSTNNQDFTSFTKCSSAVNEYHGGRLACQSGFHDL